jgi:hypothetical protein
MLSERHRSVTTSQQALEQPVDIIALHSEPLGWRLPAQVIDQRKGEAT